MDFSKIIKQLYNKRIISIKPHPMIPFILGFISLILIIIIIKINDSFFNRFRLMLYVLTIFTFIFAILHWIVVRIIKKNHK